MKVIPIHKKGDSNDPLNYRPISIISSLSKPLEKHVLFHLQKHFSKYSVFHDNQSGFRGDHSCQTALIKSNELWLDAINSGRITGSLFVDFKQAFDTIHHSILISKLSHYGLSDSSLNLITSFLRNRVQSVFHKKQFSRAFSIVNH